jgi:hypothetical protein
MNSCSVIGLIGEAEDRQISCYMHGRNKEKGCEVPEYSTGWVTELIESAVTTRHITKLE